MKSKSFAAPPSGQFECALDEASADHKRKTMLAFFSSQQINKRGSISDEILGDDCDMKNVDEVFESLLHSTFSESETSASQTLSATSAAGKGPKLGKGGRTSSVTRKPSKSKLVAGEVKVFAQGPTDQRTKLLRQLSSGCEPAAASDMHKLPADPLGALPTSHTKKYPLPRQQTWSGEGGAQQHPTGPPRSPSPTQSEYESCDPWDDY